MPGAIKATALFALKAVIQRSTLWRCCFIRTVPSSSPHVVSHLLKFELPVGEFPIRQPPSRFPVRPRRAGPKSR